MANLTLNQNEQPEPISEKAKEKLSFEVLEAQTDENFDIPILEFAESPNTNEEFDLLLKLRTEQSLYQKAESLLGRSFKNAVVHSNRGSMR